MVSNRRLKKGMVVILMFMSNCANCGRKHKGKYLADTNGSYCCAKVFKK